MDAPVEVVTKIESVSGMPLNVTCKFYSMDTVGNNNTVAKFLAEHPGLQVVYYNAKTRTLYVPEG